MRKTGIYVRMAVIVTACTVLVLSLPFPPAFGAVQRSLLLPQAQRMALSRSYESKKKYNEILLKQIKYSDAVRSAIEKQRNMSTFRWTPLLKFHFPEKANLAESMEFIFKPASIQAEIKTLRHELDDIRFSVLEKVNTAYSECYVNQEKIRFTEELLKAAQEELNRNRYRLTIGKASQNDIKIMEKSVEAKTADLALQKRSFETAKSDLSDITGLDVTSGYSFKNPFNKAKLTRDKLEGIISYTLEHDQSYYEAGVIAALAKDNLMTAEQLMRQQYGWKMDRISSFVTTSKEGKDVDTAAFQMAYDQMLQDVDAPWQGKKRILFIKIPREWFKGQISGIRYVEDEPYALFNACLDYISAAKEKADIEKEIRSQAKSDYETIITARNAYEAMAASADEAGEDLERLILLNKQGKADYQETADKRADYQANQMDTLSALKDYNDLLYAYDRFTCGAITKYFYGADIAMDQGGNAESLVAVDEEDVPYYYIEFRIQDMKFVFGLHIPEDYEPEFTDYELWYGTVRVGERTPLNRQISHLALTEQSDEDRFTVRL